MLTRRAGEDTLEVIVNQVCRKVTRDKSSEAWKDMMSRGYER